MNESTKDCVVCYKEDCKDFIPCETCKSIICVDCAQNMARISGFFCPACKSDKPEQGPLFVPNREEESERIALFQQIRDAFDILTYRSPFSGTGFIQILTLSSGYPPEDEDPDTDSPNNNP